MRFVEAFELHEMYWPASSTTWLQHFCLWYRDIRLRKSEKMCSRKNAQIQVFNNFNSTRKVHYLGAIGLGRLALGAYFTECCRLHKTASMSPSPPIYLQGPPLPLPSLEKSILGKGRRAVCLLMGKWGSPCCIKQQHGLPTGAYLPLLLLVPVIQSRSTCFSFKKLWRAFHAQAAHGDENAPSKHM